MQVIEAQCSWSWRLTITFISSRSGRWSTVSAMRVAAQIIPFGRGTGSCAGDQVAAHIGGYTRELPR
jgi:hypothetical protein